MQRHLTSAPDTMADDLSTIYECLTRIQTCKSGQSMYYSHCQVGSKLLDDQYCSWSCCH